MTSRLMAVTLVVPDYDVAIAFYVEKVGFSLLEDTDLGNGKRWVVVCPDVGGTGLLLARADNASQQAAVGFQTGGRVGFFLETDDFDGRFRQMHDAGVVFLEEPRREAYGTVVVWQDPFGNRWDLIQRH